MNNNIKHKKFKDTIFKGAPIYIGACIILIAALIFSIGIAVTKGSVDINVSQVYKAIFSKLFNISFNSIDNTIMDVIWLIRLPRILLAIAVGIGLSVSGVVMQAIVKDKIADPYVLGISSGASLGATIAVMFGFSNFFGDNSIGIFGFLGAFLVSLLVLMMSNIGSRINTTKLLLTGMALSSVCSAFTGFIVYVANDAQGMQKITFWLMGSLAGAKWQDLFIILPVVIVATLFFITQYRILNLMLLGDDVSITLGTNLNKFRPIYLLITSFMVGFLVYASGTIGFVGLIIPHFVRALFGTDHKKVLPISALLGSIFVIWADVFSRTIIKGSEIPIGILISIIGAPCFVLLITKKAYGFGGKK